MKKKIISLLALVMAAVMLFAACGKAETPTGTITPSQTDPVQTPNEEAPEETPEAPQEETPEENKISLGGFAGGTYSNAYLGIGCELDSSWTYKSAEELQELPDNLEEIFQDIAMEDTYSQFSYIFDMMAENTTDLTSININYTKVPLATQLVLLSMSEEQYIDQMLQQQKDTLIQTYEASGFTVNSMEKAAVTFLGENRTAIKTSMAIQGLPYYTLQMIYHQLGGYMVTVTLASYAEDNTEQLLELFYALD